METLRKQKEENNNKTILARKVLQQDNETGKKENGSYFQHCFN